MNNPIKDSRAKELIAVTILKRLRENQHESYFVGGCVRDLLLGTPPKDFDIATSASPDQVMQLFKKTIPVGAKYGVVMVVEKGLPFEVATFRCDQSYADGRHPASVRYTNAKEDAVRRDFTVNGLFYDPSQKKVMDWVNGRQDLKRKLIRAIGDPDRRFGEDKLRMLRAVRFASVLGFKIEPGTVGAIKRLSHKIRQVSQERIRDELIKMLTGPNPLLALRLLDQTALLKEILPEIERMKGVSQPRAFHPEGDVYKHTLLVLKQLKNAPTVLAFGCLLHDIGKPLTYKRSRRIQFHLHDLIGARLADQILTRLRFSNDLKRMIVDCVDGHMRFKDVRTMRESTLKKFMQRETFSFELEQHRIDCLASHGDLSNWRFLVQMQKTLSKQEIKPHPLINGHDLLGLGFTEGPPIGKILRSVEDRQLEKKLLTKKDALKWVQRHFSRKKH